MISVEEILEIQNLVRRVPVPPHVIHYALRLVRATRVDQPDAPDYITDLLSWGAGPRAVQFLILGGKSRAVIQGKHAVGIEDIKSVAAPVLRHRIITTFNAESSGITADDVVKKLLENVPERGEGDQVAPVLEPALKS